ncbi:MAG: glycosyltransferase family 4 protein [Bdellovibrio sp.]|nr:glycosyltransferase family 4 protein [Bdellovibrio sp.]
MDTALNTNQVPTIVIDARMAQAMNHGIAKYVSLMAQGLALCQKKKNLGYQPVFLVNSNSSKNFFSFDTVQVHSRFLSPSEIFEIPSVLKRVGAAAYHSPSFSSLWSCPVPYLITIHDLIHLRYGSFTDRLYYRFLLKPFAKKAKQIVTVSDFSKKELSTWLEVPEEKIKVVWNALEDKVESGTARSDFFKNRNLQPGRYFICLGNQKPHKNLELLFSAYQDYRQECVKKNIDPWPLVVTLPEESLRIKTQGILPSGKLPSSQIAELLKKAGGLLSPSLQEGFGLPPTEAAAEGVSLAVSDIPPHREALIDLSPSEALWVPPTEKSRWTQAFEILHQKGITPPSSESQRKIRERFSIKRIGEDMDQLYGSVLGLKPS